MDKVSRTEQSVRPVSATDEIRNALSAARSLAHQVETLTDALCGTAPHRRTHAPAQLPSPTTTALCPR